jgi:hypothetical protein
MKEDQVDEIVKDSAISDPKYGRLIRETLLQIPLDIDDVSPLRILLSGYQDAISTSVQCSDREWYNIVVLDLHDLEKKSDEEVLEIIAHEIAHVFHRHTQIHNRSERSPIVQERQEKEARETTARWGFT